MAQAPGFFGKVPARGDFLARRMPSGFHEIWETWLADFTTAARESLGDRWPEDWLTAPLWHFTLGRGVLAPNGGVGVLVASADKVGRLFPFTILGPAGAQGRWEDRAVWSQAAEQLILGALEDGFEPDALDAALQSLGAPPALWGDDRPEGHWRLEIGADGWPADEGYSTDTSRQEPGPGQSAWWCRGSDRVEPMHLRCRGLPGRNVSAAMVTGHFAFEEPVEDGF